MLQYLEMHLTKELFSFVKVLGANTVVSPDTYCCSDPTYKGIHCTVEKTDREVLLMADLMRWVYKKYVDSDDDDVVEHMESLGERPVYKGRKWEELIDHDI